MYKSRSTATRDFPNPVNAADLIQTRCAMGEGGLFFMEAEKTVAKPIPLRIQCSECKRFYFAKQKSDGEINGNCPHCHAKYHERRNGVT